MGRTQRGNNNAYCQDNEISWVDWALGPEQQDLFAFVRYMITLFRQQPVLRRRRFFHGRFVRGTQGKDITWFEANGQEMSDEAWNASSKRGLGVRLVGTEIEETDERGDPITGDTLFLMFNPYHAVARFVLPHHDPTQRWERLLDTSLRDWARRFHVDGAEYVLPARSVAVFRLASIPAPGGPA